jgi:CRP-like cAMP-binding protein
MTATEGEFIYRSGDPGRNAYILLKGEAQSLRNADDDQSIVGNLIPGESFGIMEVLVQRSRILSVKAQTDLKLLRVDGEAIRDIIDSDSTVIQALLKAITEQWASVKK